MPRNPAALERAAQTASSEALTTMETRMTWLATIANGATFIGLFGTVMGIIDAFHSLNLAGAGTLRAVAPGISAALITTTAGLLVAIPALFGYNLLTGQLREFAARMNNSARNFLERHRERCHAKSLDATDHPAADRGTDAAAAADILAMAFSARSGGQSRTQTSLRGHIVVLCDQETASDGEAFVEGSCA